MIKSKKIMLTLLFFVGFSVMFSVGFLTLQVEANAKCDLNNAQINGLIRSYYLNDQRIQWSGIETTFGVEAIVNPIIKKNFPWGKIQIEGEFYLNQPFGETILKDGNLNKYEADFKVDVFEISQLYLQMERGYFSLKLGKDYTPFGRTYFPVFSNPHFDAPFIRTEAILWRETGLFLNYQRGMLDLDFAIVNGEENKDTNSSKAIITRIGIERENWGCGVSGKIQDGISSETQKTFKSHAGIDFMFRHSPFIFSGEIIYDEYGFCQDYQGDIFWAQGFYYRDTFYKHKTPITGIGGYLDITYQKEKWTANLNYGEYYPKEISNLYHDDPIKRGIVKIAYNITQELQVFTIGLLENERTTEEWKSEAKGTVIMAGLQYRF